MTEPAVVLLVAVRSPMARALLAAARARREERQREREAQAAREAAEP